MIALVGFVPTTQAETIRPDASEAFSKLLLSRQNKAVMAPLFLRNAAATPAESRLEAQKAVRQKKEALQKQKAEQAALQKQKAEQAALQKQKAEQAALQKQKAEQAALQKQKAQQAALQKQEAQQASLQRQKDLRDNRLEEQIAVLKLEEGLLETLLHQLESIVPSNPKQARRLQTEERQLENSIATIADLIAKDERALGTPVR
jgi:hypothetical protein